MINDAENLRSYQKIAVLIKEEFINDAHAIGEKLPSERELADTFKISRTLVREALIMLELEGYISIKKGAGVFILAKNKEEKTNNPIYHDVGPFELLQARQLIESHIAEFAALQAKPNDILMLKNILQKEQAHLKTNEQQNDYSEDEEFHLAIAEITQNTVLIQLQKELWKYRSNPMWEKLHEHISDNHYRALWVTDHEEIFYALQRKDPQLAKKAVWQHLEHVKQKLFELSDIDAVEFDGFLYQQTPFILNK